MDIVHTSTDISEPSTGIGWLWVECSPRLLDMAVSCELRAAGGMVSVAGWLAS